MPYRDADRSFSSIFLFQPNAFHGRGSIAPRSHSLEQVLQVLFQFLTVLPGGYPVQSRCRILLDVLVCLLQEVHIHQIHQVGKYLFWFIDCLLCYPLKFC